MSRDTLEQVARDIVQRVKDKEPDDGRGMGEKNLVATIADELEDAIDNGLLAAPNRESR